MKHWSVLGLGTIALVLACGDVDRESSSGAALTGVSAGASGSSGSDDDDGPDDDDDGSGGPEGDDDDGGGPGGDDGVAFDLGSPPADSGDAPPPELGCSKIDFVFVVDNSLSMEDDQTNLVSNFPALIEGIESSLEEVDDFHVGVVATDAYGWNDPACRHMGGLVTQTGGEASSMAVCGPYAEGNNYMTEADDLADSFACAAKMGIGGFGVEAPMDALSAVVRGDVAGPGECNQGFLRSDALLVAVIITDEWDGPGDPELFTSAGTPQDWYDTVLDAKQFPENAAVVSLVNYAGGPCPPVEAVNDGANLVTFTELFGDNGFVGGICDDYGPVFSQAVDLIDEACKNFQPPEG